MKNKNREFSNDSARRLVKRTHYYSKKFHFRDFIGLESRLKSERLEKVLARGVAYSKSSETKRVGGLLGRVNALQPVSTGRLSEDLKLPASLILKKLKKLEASGFIVRAGRVALNRSIIWKTTGVNVLNGQT